MSLSEAEESFITDLVLNVDLFMSQYCGYWLRGVGRVKGLGWLARDIVETQSDDDVKQIARLAREGKPLPKGWYLIDRPAAEKALAEGQKKYGEDFAYDYDGPMADVAVQRALLGDVVYG